AQILVNQLTGSVVGVLDNQVVAAVGQLLQLSRGVIDIIDRVPGLVHALGANSGGVVGEGQRCEVGVHDLGEQVRIGRVVVGERDGAIGVRGREHIATTVVAERV